MHELTPHPGNRGHGASTHLTGPPDPG